MIRRSAEGHKTKEKKRGRKESKERKQRDRFTCAVPGTCTGLSPKDQTQTQTRRSGSMECQILKLGPVLRGNISGDMRRDRRSKDHRALLNWQYFRPGPAATSPSRDIHPCSDTVHRLPRAAVTGPVRPLQNRLTIEPRTTSVRYIKIQGGS